MVFSWQIIESTFLSAEAVMAKDAALLAQLDPNGPPLLHFYDWEAPCLTYGYFVNPACYLNLEILQHLGLQKARRPTGGGIIFHLSDFAFSVLLPAHHPHFSLNPLDNYMWINRKVAEAIASFHSQTLQPQLLDRGSICVSEECHAFCMAKPTQYDLVIKGKKMGGAAQRLTRKGLLHQASLSLILPPFNLLQKVLKNDKVVLDAMKKYTYYLLAEQIAVHDMQIAREGLKRLLKENLPRIM